MIKWKNINWLLVASSFTAAYLIFIVVWIGPHKIIAFTETDQLNAIGDFLAGIFSPLAFIWLVAAVLTQRQELTDTRDQFAENQKVVDAQLKTINDQSVLLQQQHTLAEEIAKKTYRLNLFDQRLAIYNELVALHVKILRYELSRELWGEIQKVHEKSHFVFGSSFLNYLTMVDRKCAELFVYEELHQNSWYFDQVLGGDFPQEPEHIAIRDNSAAQRKAISDLLTSKKLREIMWASLNVSDD